MIQGGIILLAKGLVITRIGAARHRFQHSKKEVLTRSPVAIARQWTVATSGSSRKSDCNVGTQVTTPEESHPQEQEVISWATAHDRSPATAHDRNRARAHDRRRAKAHNKNCARAHIRSRSIEIIIVQEDRPHKAIDHTEEGFKATRGVFEFKKKHSKLQALEARRSSFRKASSV